MGTRIVSDLAGSRAIESRKQSARRSPFGGRLAFDQANAKETDFSRCRRPGGPIGHSFYPARYFEKSLIADQPTKKFCEIAAIPVSPSYCVKLARVFSARRSGVKSGRAFV
jgi:hypothetical protein